MSGTLTTCLQELERLDQTFGTKTVDQCFKLRRKKKVPANRDKREFVPWKDLRKLAKRQRWICGICNDHENRMADDRKYTVLDHIDPQRIDFNHPSNWQAAHASCNAKKNAKNQTEVSKMVQLENMAKAAEENE